MIATARKKTGGRLHSRRQLLRKVIFQIHLWTGLVLGFYFAVLGLSGSALVFKSEINRAIAPHLYSVSAKAGAKALSLQTIAAGFMVAHPDEEISSFLLPLAVDETVIIGYKSKMAGPEKGRPNWRQCFVNPYSGVILGDEANGGIFNIIQRLHFRLLLDELGTTLNRWGSLFIIAMLFSGLWLWWPSTSRFAREFKQRTTIKTGGSFKRVVYDTHNTFGFYSAAVLLVLSITAASHFFKDQTLAIVSTITTSKLEKKEKRPPKVESKLTFDEIVAGAKEAAPDMVPYIITDSLRVKMVKPGEKPVGAKFVTVVLNPLTGAAECVERPEADLAGRQILNWLMPVHFGQWGPGYTYYAVKLLWFIAGFCPLVLCVSGCVMYLERKGIKIAGRR